MYFISFHIVSQSIIIMYYLHVQVFKYTYVYSWAYCLMFTEINCKLYIVTAKRAYIDTNLCKKVSSKVQVAVGSGRTRFPPL